MKSICLASFCLAAILGLVQARNEYTKLFERCTKEKNTFDCLKRRALEVLDSAIKDDTVYVINDYVSIGRDAATGRSFEAAVQLNATDKTVDEQLDQKFHEYLSSRSIRLTIPGEAFEGKVLFLYNF